VWFTGSWRVYSVLIIAAISIVSFTIWLKKHDAKIALNAVLLERQKVKEADDKLNDQRRKVRSNPPSRRELVDILRQGKWNRVN